MLAINVIEGWEGISSLLLSSGYLFNWSLKKTFVCLNVSKVAKTRDSFKEEVFDTFIFKNFTEIWCSNKKWDRFVENLLRRTGKSCIFSLIFFCKNNERFIDYCYESSACNISRFSRKKPSASEITRQAGGGIFKYIVWKTTEKKENWHAKRTQWGGKNWRSFPSQKQNLIILVSHLNITFYTIVNFNYQLSEGNDWKFAHHEMREKRSKFSEINIVYTIFNSLFNYVNYTI